jgi:hypothetical protein
MHRNALEDRGVHESIPMAVERAGTTDGREEWNESANEYFTGRMRSQANVHHIRDFKHSFIRTD